MPHANQAKGSRLIFLYQAPPHNGSAHSEPDLLATSRPRPLRDHEPKASLTEGLVQIHEILVSQC